MASPWRGVNHLPQPKASIMPKINIRQRGSSGDITGCVADEFKAILRQPAGSKNANTNGDASRWGSSIAIKVGHSVGGIELLFYLYLIFFSGGKLWPVTFLKSIFCPSTRSFCYPTPCSSNWPVGNKQSRHKLISIVLAIHDHLQEHSL